MENITVKHYLNKQLKAISKKDGLAYPVYVRVSYFRKNERFKSGWITYPCTEKDFTNNPDIAKAIQYESDIIRYIVATDSDVEEIGISEKLNGSKISISEIFRQYTIDIKDIKKSIFSYIGQKANISEEIFQPFFSSEHLSSDNWLELANKVDFTKAQKDRVLYFSMLLEFEETYEIKPDNHEWTPGCVMNRYEWFILKARDKFILYSTERKLLPSETIHNITDNLDKDISNYHRLII